MTESHPQFDFARLSQLNLLRQAALRSVVTRRGAASAAAQKAVLFRIDAYARANGECWVSYATFATETNLSLSQVQRAIDALKQASLITSEVRYRADLGRNAAHLRIVWSELELLRPSPAAESPSQTSSRATAPQPRPRPALLAAAPQPATAPQSHSEPIPPPDAPLSQSFERVSAVAVVTRDQSVISRDQSVISRDQSVIPSGAKYYSDLELKTPPPPTPVALRAQCATATDWQAVVVECAALGIADRQAVVAAARQAGVSPAEALALCDYYRSRSGAWGPGALAWRLRNAAPGCDPASGWPPPAKAYLVRRAAQAAAENSSARRGEAVATAERVRDSDAALERAWSEHGHEIERALAAGGDAAAELIDRLPPFLGRYLVSHLRATGGRVADLGLRAELLRIAHPHHLYRSQ